RCHHGWTVERSLIDNLAVPLSQKELGRVGNDETNPSFAATLKNAYRDLVLDSEEGLRPILIAVYGRGLARIHGCGQEGFQLCEDLTCRHLEHCNILLRDRAEVCERVSYVYEFIGLGAKH